MRRPSSLRSGRAHRPPSRAGASLVELMVALFVLAIVGLGTASLLASTSKLQRLTRSRNELATLGRAKLEALRAAGLPTSSGGTPQYASDTLELALGGSLAQTVPFHADSLDDAQGRRYRRRWVVTAGPAGTRAVVLRVEPLQRGRFEARWVDVTALILIR